MIPTSNHNLRFLYVARRSLYIFWFLHQTTTVIRCGNYNTGCISFDSYIKPQLNAPFAVIHCVVYLLIPTSNHNYMNLLSTIIRLYIFWFLHQTTTGSVSNKIKIGCISFDSYIKPQPIDLKVLISSVYQSLFLIRNGE